MSFLSDVVSFGTGYIPVVGPVISTGINSLSGGTTTSGMNKDRGCGPAPDGQFRTGNGGGCPCQGQPPDVDVAAMFNKAATTAQGRADVAAFKAKWVGIWGETKWNNGPGRIAWECFGALDCNPGYMRQEFVNLWQKYGPIPVNQSVPANIQGQTVDVTPTTTSGLGGVVTDIWGNIKDAAGNIVKSTVGGAVTGAQVSTSGAASGSAAGLNLVSAMPLLLIGGALVAFVIFKKK